MSRGERAEDGDGSAAFYARLMKTLSEAEVPFLVGGTCAVNEYIGLGRPTKDLDIFSRASDFPKVLDLASRAGFEVQVEDERWIGKIVRDEHFCDVVFGSANMVAPVTEEWFAEKHLRTIYGIEVHLLPPTELVWSKLFIMDRYKFDGNDVVHILLRKNDAIDWRRLMRYGDQHWEVLLMHLLRFRYIYPVERELVPAWVLDELLGRLKLQRDLPAGRKRVCRGRAFSRDDFIIDLAEWGYADLVGEEGEMLRYSPSEKPHERAEQKAEEDAPGGGGEEQGRGDTGVQCALGPAQAASDKAGDEVGERGRAKDVRGAVARQETGHAPGTRKSRGEQER